MLSTRNVILLVSRAAIFETNAGRCASGNVVLGAGAEFVRFMLARPLVEEDGRIEAVVVLGAERRRPGRDGTANVASFDNANVISLEDFVWGAATKVNGLIGYGVSDRKKPSVRMSKARFIICHPPLKSWIR